MIIRENALFDNLEKMQLLRGGVILNHYVHRDVFISVKCCIYTTLPNRHAGSFMLSFWTVNSFLNNGAELKRREMSPIWQHSPLISQGY